MTPGAEKSTGGNGRAQGGHRGKRQATSRKVEVIGISGSTEKVSLVIGWRGFFTMATGPRKSIISTASGMTIESITCERYLAVVTVVTAGSIGRAVLLGRRGLEVNGGPKFGLAGV